MHFSIVFAVMFVLCGWQPVHALVLNCEREGFYTELNINRDAKTAKFGFHEVGKYTTVGDFWFWVLTNKAVFGMDTTSFMFNTRSQKLTLAMASSDDPGTRPQSSLSEFRCARPLN